MTNSPFMKKLPEMIRNKDGNFAMMAGILLPVIFVAGSLVLDTTNALSMKTSLQNAADSAALATTSQLAEGQITEAEAVAYATQFFNGQISGDAAAFDGLTATPTVTLTKTGIGATTIWKVEVSVLGSQKTTGLGKFVGKDTIDVVINSTSESAHDGSNPISMMLVLDRSGSMTVGSVKKTVPLYCGWGWWRYQCGTTESYTGPPKMTVLKQAVSNLVGHISASDPTNEYARMGAVAYNYETVHSDKFEPTWNKSQVTTFANALVAEYGTYSVDAMEWAVDRVTGPGEINAHYSKNGSKKPLKFIVFMTDGRNETGSEWGDNLADNDTKAHCQTAKSKGVTIFSVAFLAPERGQALLLACASSPDKYYDAQSADDLLKAFTDIGKEAAKQVTRLTN